MVTPTLGGMAVQQEEPRVLGSLSPSRAADFLSCPLMYRFRTVDRLPEPASPDAVRGTLVHQVLEDIFDLPAAERTRERAHAMEKTRQEQEELLERARREIRDERDRAVAELRREAVDLSLAAASRLIERRLDGETDRKLVLEFLAGMDGKP